MKKIVLMLVAFIAILGVTGCNNNEKKPEDMPRAQEDSLRFKEEYESLNGDYRALTINENNPFVYSSGADIISKMQNGETFYVYFGSNFCPWCRSVIEKVIEVANDANISKIYYVNIWGASAHEEVLRDVYELDNKGKPVLKQEGQGGYEVLLKLLDNVLSDYTLTNSKGKTVKVGEKRIYAPNFIYVENGKAVKLVSGNSEKQKDSNGELSEEILQDEEKIFTEFFQK